MRYGIWNIEYFEPEGSRAMPCDGLVTRGGIVRIGEVVYLCTKQRNTWTRLLPETATSDGKGIVECRRAYHVVTRRHLPELLASGHLVDELARLSPPGGESRALEGEDSLLYAYHRCLKIRFADYDPARVPSAGVVFLIRRDLVSPAEMLALLTVDKIQLG